MLHLLIVPLPSPPQASRWWRIHSAERSNVTSAFNCLVRPCTIRFLWLQQKWSYLRTQILPSEKSSRISFFYVLWLSICELLPYECVIILSFQIENESFPYFFVLMPRAFLKDWLRTFIILELPNVFTSSRSQWDLFPRIRDSSNWQLLFFTYPRVAAYTPSLLASSRTRWYLQLTFWRDADGDVRKTSRDQLSTLSENQFTHPRLVYPTLQNIFSHHMKPTSTETERRSETHTEFPSLHPIPPKQFTVIANRTTHSQFMRCLRTTRYTRIYLRLTRFFIRIKRKTHARIPFKTFVSWPTRSVRINHVFLRLLPSLSNSVFLFCSLGNIMSFNWSGPAAFFSQLNSFCSVSIKLKSMTQLKKNLRIIFPNESHYWRNIDVLLHSSFLISLILFFQVCLIDIFHLCLDFIPFWSWLFICHDSSLSPHMNAIFFIFFL